MRIEAKVPDAAVKRSGFVAYDNHGVAVDEPENKVADSATEIKRSGFIGSDDHQFTDEELEEQVLFADEMPAYDVVALVIFKTQC